MESIKREIAELRHSINEIHKEFLEFKKLYDSVLARTKAMDKVGKMLDEMDSINLRVKKMEGGGFDRI